MTTAVKLTPAQTFKIYPNPVNSYVTVTSNDRINEVELLDISGKLIQKFKVQSDRYTIDTSKLPSGVYLLNGLTESGVVKGKFVKE